MDGVHHYFLSEAAYAAAQEAGSFVVGRGALGRTLGRPQLFQSNRESSLPQECCISR